MVTALRMATYCTITIPFFCANLVSWYWFQWYNISFFPQRAKFTFCLILLCAIAEITSE